MSEKKISYQLLNRGALVGIQVTAPSMQRLYLDAGLALIDSRVKLEWLNESDKQTLSITAQKREDLMRNWLMEIEYLYARMDFLPRRIVFDFFDGKTIKATLWGEMHDDKRHGMPIKYGWAEQPVEFGEKNTEPLEFFARVYFQTVHPKIRGRIAIR